MESERRGAYEDINFIAYLFTCSLFNDAFSISDYIASDKRMIVNNEL
jgi:hypothetical protein